MYFSAEKSPMPYTSNAVDNLFNTVNKIAIGVLSVGHIILFFMFLLMGIHLFRRSKRIVYNAQMQGINEAYIKKKGRNVSCILVLIGFGFLTGLLTKFLLIFLSSSTSPPFLVMLNREYVYKADSLKKIKSLDLHDQFWYLIVCSCSFLGFIFFSYGLYVLPYGKTVLKSKSKSSGYLLIGIISFVFFGFASFLRILESLF